MKSASIIFRVIKTTMVVLAVSTLFVFALASAAEAKLKKAMWGFGENLSTLTTQPDPTGETRTLVINGAELVFRSETTKSDLLAVLDEADTECDGLTAGTLSSTLRDHDAQTGYVACFTNAGAMTASELLAAAEEFVASGDLSSLGSFRYTYARATKTGIHRIEATLVAPNLRRFMPATGDAPGLDVKGIPRPPGARRMFSAFQVDKPYQLAIYVGATGTPEQLAASYQQQLRDEGWDVYTRGAKNKRIALVSMKDELMVFIVLKQRKSGVTVTVAAGH